MHVTFQAKINKRYARTWLGRPYEYPIKFQNLQISSRGIFLLLGTVFFSYMVITPLEEGVTLHFNILESPLPKDTLCQVWLKLAKWFLSKRFLTVVNVFSLCGYYLSLKKYIAHKLNKFEFPSPKNTLCHVWLKLAHWFWRRFSKVVNIFSICCYYLPFKHIQHIWFF